MTKNITIRPARVQESQLLSELAFRSKSYWGYSPEFMEACRTELSVSNTDITSPSFYCNVGEFHGKIVGFYTLEVVSEKQFELEALFVDPKHMRQGFGKKLIEHAKLFARNAGAQSILIQSDPNAEKFYLAAGAFQVGSRESGSIPGRYLPEFKIILNQEDVARSNTK